MGLFGDIKSLRRDYTTLGNSGTSEQQAGYATTDDAISRIQKGIDEYQQKLLTGRVLPDSVYRSYGLAKGGVADNAARDINSLRASLAQRATASGGFISPEAQAAINARGETDIGANEMAGFRDIDISRSKDELSSTQDLYGRIDAGKSQLLNAGQFREQLGQQARIAAMLAKLDKIKASQQMIMGLFGGLTGASRGSG